MTVIYFMIIHLISYVHIVKKGLEIWHAIIYISILPLSIGTAYVFGNILYSPLFQEFYFVLALAIFLCTLNKTRR